MKNYASRLQSPSVRRGKASPGSTGATTPTSKLTSPAGKISYSNKTPPAKGTSPVENHGKGTDATIQQLREELKEAMSRDASTKAALSKSDAVILELRSNQRQLKRQLDLLQEERAKMNKELNEAKERGGDNSSSNNVQQEQQIKTLQAHIDDLSKQLEASQRRQQQQQQEISNSAHSREQLQDNNKNEKVGELQVQLDRAHAQILTADMVRKELEDTLEAEQYTWELRVQDQERQITRLQEDCDTLARDLDQCRSQWKDAEVGWNQELEDLKEDLARARQQLQLQGQNSTTTNEPQNDLFQKIQQLESERAELQSCLDEALKELEAVDAELQTEGDGTENKRNSKSLGKGSNAEISESLKHLLRWIYQEGPVETRVGHKHLLSLDNDPQKIISLVQKALEGWLDATSQTTGDKQNNNPDEMVQKQAANIDKLKQQISVYEDELKNRDSTCAELRESLKEAVSLLKPLQDAVAQTEEEKTALLRQLKDYEKDRQSSQDEIAQQSRKMNALEEQIAGLEQQLEEEKRLSSARQSLLTAHSQHKSASSNLNRSVMSDTSINESVDGNSRLASIKKAREELRRKRETEANLQKLLKDAQSRFNNLHDRNEDMTARNRELQGQIEKLGVKGEQRGEGNNTLVTTWTQKDEELRHMRLEIERMRLIIDNQSSQDGSAQQNSALQEELDHMRSEVAQKEQVNRVLNKSLKEALGLLKPLQMHLEEAEMEKADISKELRNLRKRFRQLQMGETDDHSRSTHGGADVSIELIKIKDELEETVRQLELENSQLHEALDDMTEDGKQINTEAKLRQQLVELNSRYEVTQNKLEDAHVENHALVKALKQKEMEEKKLNGDIIHLEQNLQKTEAEFIHAKKIAQSALIKVEELTMSNRENFSTTTDSPSI